MLLARMNRFPTTNDLRREFNRLFNDFTGGFDPSDLFRARAFPALNVSEDSEALYLEAEVPGLRMDDLEIYVVGNELTLKGQRPADEGEQRVFHRRERGTGMFSRVVTLPIEVNAEKVEAALKDGVLHVILPKAEAARARRIQVKSA